MTKWIHFFGTVALFLQLHNAIRNSYLSDHPQGSSEVVPVKGIKQLLLEFVLLIQAGNIFHIYKYFQFTKTCTYIQTYACVYIYLCECVYIFTYC